MISRCSTFVTAILKYCLRFWKNGMVCIYCSRQQINRHAPFRPNLEIETGELPIPHHSRLLSYLSHFYRLYLDTNDLPATFYWCLSKMPTFRKCFSLTLSLPLYLLYYCLRGKVTLFILFNQIKCLKFATNIINIGGSRQYFLLLH